MSEISFTYAELTRHIEDQVGVFMAQAKECKNQRDRDAFENRAKGVMMAWAVLVCRPAVAQGGEALAAHNDDYARMVAPQESSFVTGEVYGVTGGNHLPRHASGCCGGGAEMPRRNSRSPPAPRHASEATRTTILPCTWPFSSRASAAGAASNGKVSATVTRTTPASINAAILASWPPSGRAV